MRIIGVQGRLEEEPGDGLEELMAKQCVVTEPCDAESLRTSAVDTVRSPPPPLFPTLPAAFSTSSELLFLFAGGPRPKHARRAEEGARYTLLFLRSAFPPPRPVRRLNRWRVGFAEHFLLQLHRPGVTMAA